MKKIMLIIGFLLISVLGKSQFRALWFEGTQYFQLGDSVVTIWGEDTLTSPNMVRALISGLVPSIKTDSSNYSDTSGFAIFSGDSVYVSGQDEWIRHSDTIRKVDSANFALNAPGIDSIFISGQNEWVGDMDTVRKVDSALYAPSDSLFHDDTQQWLLSGDTIPKADSVRDQLTANNRLFVGFVDFYLGTTNPTASTRLNIDGAIYPYQIALNRQPLYFSYPTTNYYDIQQSGATDLELQFDGSNLFEFKSSGGLTGSSYSNNYLWLKNNAASSVNPIYSFVGSETTGLGLSGTNNMALIAGGGRVFGVASSKASGAFYSGITDPDNTTRLNYDGSFYATELNALVANLVRAALDTFILNPGPLADTITESRFIKEVVEAENFDSIVIGDHFIRFNESEGVHEFGTGINDVIWQGALEDLVQVYNNSGQAISNGDPVKFTGSIGDSITTVSRVGAGDSVFNFFAGLATIDIPNGSWGFACTRGYVRGPDLTGLPLAAPIYLSDDSTLTGTKPAYPSNVLLLGGVVKTGVDGIFYVNWSLAFQRQLQTKTYGFTSQGIGAGTFYKGGFYDFPTTDANLTQAATTQAYGTSNIAYSAHPFIVCGGAGTVDAGVVGLRVTGTSVDDEGNQTPGDADTILTDITSVALDEYYEAKKFDGTATYELITISGSPTTYSFDFNYGYAKYDDFWNTDFYLAGSECVWRGGATDATGFDIELLHHNNTGWTYAATGFEAGNTPIATRSVDQAGFLGVLSGVESAWKRDDFSTFINGTDSQGVLFRINTGAPNTIQTMDLHVNVAID